MAYTSIVSGSNTFVPRAPGYYVLSTLGFSDPKSEVRIKGATRNRDGSLSSSKTVVLEKDVTVAGVVKRVRAVVTETIYLDPNFEVSDVQQMTACLNSFNTTSGFLNRQLQGEA